MAETHETISFAGNDTELAARLRNAFQSRSWSLSIGGTTRQIVRILQESRNGRERLGTESEWHWVKDFFTPLVLEIDYVDPESTEIVRDIKRLYGAIPVIVIGSNVDLAALSVARMDGADALFRKSDLDLDRLCDAVGDAVARVGRWRKLLDQFDQKAAVV